MRLAHTRGGTRPVAAPIPTSATEVMLPGCFSFCTWMAWKAAAQAGATLSVSLTSCEDWTIVGVEIRYRGLVAPDGTQTALPTGIDPPNRALMARCTLSWMPAPRCRLITASTPPFMLPIELVGLTQASAC